VKLAGWQLMSKEVSVIRKFRITETNGKNHSTDMNSNNSKWQKLM